MMDGRDTYGIDLLIPRGVALEDLVAALQSEARIPQEAIVRPGDDEAARGLAIYGYPVWAAIHSYPSGEISWKADLGAKTPREHVAIGQLIAQRLGTAIVWPDEATLAPNAAIRCAPNGATLSVSLVDIESDDGDLAGFIVQIPRIDETPAKIAKRNSWKSVALVDGVEVPYRSAFSAREFERIKCGLIPKDMEDKWFIYYEAPHLFLHRSWTGQGVYRLTFDEKADEALSIEALCAKDVLSRSTPAYHARLVHWLIHNLLLGANEPFPLPPGDSGDDGVLQHHTGGTAYAELKSPPTGRRWWERWLGPK
jgi:hypothetical protein